MRIKSNSDKTIKAEIRKKLEENDNFCISKPERTLDNQCMCKEFRELKEGWCRCGLYLKYD